jgi:hypothetical protein
MGQQAVGGGNDMIKNLASSFLKKETTAMEYDMGQATSMQGGIIFNMLLMWFLHFKLEQVQPLLVTTVNGFVQLAYNPLFQVYVLGRKLERPFKTPIPPMAQQTNETETEAEASEGITDEVVKEEIEVSELEADENCDEHAKEVEPDEEVEEDSEKEAGDISEEEDST